MAWVVVLVAGCRSDVRDAAPVRRTDLPCTPTVHDTAEARRGPPLFEAYRFLGGSSDGKRVALMLTHMGPGSGQPVGGIHVAEAGSEKEVLGKSYFAVTGTEANLPKVERGITDEYAAELASVGVEVGKHVPEHQAWCSDAAGRIRFNGFLGDYDVSADGQRASFRLDAPGAVRVQAQLAR